MRRHVLLAATCVLSTVLLAGCGTDYYTKESTVFVEKNKSIVATDVEEFDTDSYDEDELKKYVEETIDSFNDSNDGSLKLKKLTVEDGSASLTIKYKNADEYTSFSGTEIFVGTIAEALAAGYDFDADFAKVDDGTVTSSDKSAFMDEEGYKVVIYMGTGNVCVPSNIKYASINNTKLTDSKTISVEYGSSLLAGNDSTESVTEENSTEAVENSTETTEAADVDGSVSEDDLLSSVEDDAQVTFDFEDDSEDEAPITYITYIIYK